MTDIPTSQARALAVPSGRIARLSRLGSLGAGVMGNMALGGMAQLGQGRRPRMRNLLLTPRNLSRVAEELAQMRGAAMKIGQLMSMDTGEMLPPELAQIMARLRADAHFMPPAQLKGVLSASWGADWQRSFRRFDVRPIAAASIGQVHRAQLRDGRDLAIKVQYPGVARSIDSDVANVGALIRLSGLVPKGFEIASYLEEGRRQLHEETDYAREGGCLAQFGALLEGSSEFIVPALHADWSTRDILAMSYVEAAPIEDAGAAQQEQRDAIATRLIDLLLRELFEFGLMQTDPNFANYRYDPASARIVLLDFGATREIEGIVANEYRHLMKAGLAGDRAGLEAAAERIGFLSPAVEPQFRTRIVRMMQMVFDALNEGEVYDFARTDLSRAMQVEGMALAEEGFLPPPLPIDALYLQRKFAGMFLLAARLGAKVRVRALLARYL